MPPKKKGKKGKKKKKNQDGELTIEDKYKRTLEEIEALKDHLSIRKALARRSQQASEEWKEKMQQAEMDLHENADTHRAVSANLTRQYKTMQSDMGLRIHQLETELARTRTHLENTEIELKKTKEEKERMSRDKDQEIADLRLKIDTMGMQYEHILNDTLDKLIEKIGAAKDKWEDKSTLIQSRNKQTLLEFGLHPLDI